MDFVHSAEVLERENTFLPCGFDTPNLIQELVKGNMMVSASGDPLLYEEVITKPEANSSQIKRGVLN